MAISISELIRQDLVNSTLMDDNFILDEIFADLTLITFIHLLPQERIIPFILKMGLIAYHNKVGNNPQRYPFCATCKKNMNVENHTTYKIGYRFRCINKHSILNPFEFTWFERSHLSFQQILITTFCWVSNIPIHLTIEQTKIDEYTTIEWFVSCREVCDIVMANDSSDKKIGGKGLIVELDEAHLHTRKNNAGRILKTQQIWIFGGVCRETKERFVCQVPDRTKETLMYYMQKYVEKDSIIITDDWRSYKGCENYGFSKHLCVVHKYNFVCPSDRSVYTNTIERFWRSLKETVKSFKPRAIDCYISERLYRDKYFKSLNSVSEKFKHFLGDIRRVYSGIQDQNLDYPNLDDSIPSPSAPPSPPSQPSTSKKSKTKTTDASPSTSKSSVHSEKQSSTLPVTNDEEILHLNCVEMDRIAKDILRDLIENGSFENFETLENHLLAYDYSIDTMIDLVRGLNNRIVFDQNSHSIDTTTQNNIERHIPIFNRDFAPIRTGPDGNCFYNAVSIGLVGSQILNQVLRLLALRMAVKYKTEFQKHLDIADRMQNYMAFLLGIATPTSLSDTARYQYPNYISVTEGIFNWANETSEPALAIAIRRPIYIMTANQMRYRNIQQDEYMPIPHEIGRVELDNLFETGRIAGIVNLRIHQSYDRRTPIRIVHTSGNHFVSLLRRNLSENYIPQAYITIRCLSNDMFNIQQEDQEI